MDTDDLIRSFFRLSGPARPGASIHLLLPLTCEVSTTVSETITGCPAYPNYNNKTFSWPSKYLISLSKATCEIVVTVRLKVIGETMSSAQTDSWKQAIESKWNSKAVLTCTNCLCPRGLSITIDVQFVTSDEHYVVTAQLAGATSDGRAGLGGTSSMQNWGVTDTVDITHEFGHMLGNPEEYFTTNGVDYTAGGTKQGFRDSDGGIMNNPANDPTVANYDPIRLQVEKCMGGGAKCSASSGDFPAQPPPGSANA